MAEGSMFSTLDYLCVAGVAVIGIYFIAFRKKKEEAPPAFKKLTVG